jgi:hypothetical protein
MLTSLPDVKTLLCDDYTALTDDILSSTEPLILKGLIKHWPLVQQGKKSTVDAVAYLRSFYNQKPVVAMIAEAQEQGRFFFKMAIKGP